MERNCQVRLGHVFSSTVTNTATLWHKFILPETKESILFSKPPNRGFHIWFFTIKPLIKTGINKDIAALHQHKKICVPVDAAYRWNLILMNLTIKLNNRQFFFFHTTVYQYGWNWMVASWMLWSGSESLAGGGGVGSEWLILCSVYSDTIRVPLSKVLNLQQPVKLNSGHVCYSFGFVILVVKSYSWRKGEKLLS